MEKEILKSVISPELENKILSLIDSNINQLKEGKIDQDILNILERWYTSYQKIITFLGTSSGIVLLYLGLQLIQLLPQEAEAKANVAEVFKENRELIYAGVGCLIFSIISMVICLMTTYSWYKTGLVKILSSVKSPEMLLKTIGDDMQYDSISGNMAFWGMISLISGYATGIGFVLGLLFYAAGIYEVFPELIYSK